jgi:hypothetical protein
MARGRTVRDAQLISPNSASASHGSRSCQNIFDAPFPTLFFPERSDFFPERSDFSDTPFLFRNLFS